MASFPHCKFKILFIVLVLLVFIGFSFFPMSHSSLRPSKMWLGSISQNVHFIYISAKIRETFNKTSVMQHILKHTSEEQVSNATDVATTRMSTLEATQDTMTTRYNEAYPHNYRFILDEPDICTRKKPFLVLMVPVAPQQVAARDSIRNTWGNESVVRGKNVIVLFVLGLVGEAEAAKRQEQLNLESRQYHDLIQSNFLDTYKNLTTKTMVIMDWLTKHCTQASYAMKIDSDMFLNVENLMSLLLEPSTPKENYITGMVMWNRPVVRDPSSKWYVPKEVYPEEFYATYLLGMGYVFSNDLPKKLVSVSKDIQPFYIEDAYIGACLKQLGIPPSTPPNPSQFKAYFDGNYNRDEFASVITTILSSPEQLVKFWQDLKRPT